MTALSNARALAAALLLASAAPSLAAGGHDGHGATPAGMAGGSPSRTVEVVLNDTFFAPETIDIAPGETVRFRIRNAGAMAHEFGVGTLEMHEAHQAEMQMLSDHGVLKPTGMDMAAAKKMQAAMGHGMHDMSNTVLVGPGKTAELVWTVPANMMEPVEFACGVPGHAGAGMVGTFHAPGH
ncbi:MAG: plastocyanin/azurin family copper-binding protein [Pseudomonadota bacterium]|nr:plastocyanin/azurin family copper-binding protein [Pseudomonadota bacterium]